MLNELVLNVCWLNLPSGLFYGYPYCWSQYNLTTGKPPGTQWATDKFIKDIGEHLAHKEKELLTI